MELTKGEETIQLILSLIGSCRYLAAHELYISFLEEVRTVEATVANRNAEAAQPETDCKDTVQQKENHHSHEGFHLDAMAMVELNQWLTSANEALETHENELKVLRERIVEVRKALDFQDQHDQWVLGASHFGVNTYYKLDEEDGSIIIKMEGSNEELPLFEQCAVIHEADLFHTWVPFCTSALLIDKIGTGELVNYMNISIPPLSRDFSLHAFAADCLHEHGKLVITGRSIEEYGPKPLPLKPVGWFHNRMVVKEFKVICEINSPTNAKFVQSTIIAHLNPRAPLPQTFINFIMKNVAGLMLYLFQRQAIKVSNDPNCEHAQRIRSNREFYGDWVLPKLREFCDAKGWEQPIISSLGEEGIPPSKEK